MNYIRVVRYRDLPEPKNLSEPEADALVDEFDKVFGQLSAALRKLFVVNDSGKGDRRSAAIRMCKYVDICRHHTVVVDEFAWKPEVIDVMHTLLQSVPDGWTFGIDASVSPGGQAHIVVHRDGTVHGWTEFKSRRTLDRFGFPAERRIFWNARLWAVDCIRGIRSRRQLEAVLKRARNAQSD